MPAGLRRPVSDFFRRILPCLIVFCAATAEAARPMITDDAEITDPKSCQLESWIQSNRDSREYWALPACNLGGVEWTLGGGRLRPDHGAALTDTVFQAKTALKPLDANGWGLALTAGTTQQRPSSTGGREWYLQMPLSLSFHDNRFLLHTNLGWLREQESRQNHLTWGVGTTTRLGERSWLIAESFGRNHGRPLYQVGLRHWIVPDRVQIDMTYGDRFGAGGQQRWFSIGLRLLSPSFLP